MTSTYEGSFHRLELSEFYRHLVFKPKHDEIGAKLGETHDDGFSSDEDWVGKKPKNVGLVETVYDNWGTSSWEFTEAKIEIMNNTKESVIVHSTYEYDGLWDADPPKSRVKDQVLEKDNSKTSSKGDRLCDQEDTTNYDGLWDYEPNDRRMNDHELVDDCSKTSSEGTGLCDQNDPSDFDDQW
uniref:Uncharacterized protein n=1 Tax=Acrobeloides nanus TaxID=290746 RepID=A0A914DJU0_9BILA